MTGPPVQPLNTSPDGEGLADPLLEHRIAAAADLARHEERLRVAALTALRRWTELVENAVLGGDTLTADAAEIPPDANAIPALSAQWSAILSETVDAELAAMLGDIFGQILADEQTVSARPWQEAYIAEVHNRLTGVPDSTFDLIRDVIADGQAGGADIPTLRGLISDVLATRGESTWAGRAQTIARTEAIGAWNGGQLQAWRVQAAATGDVREKVWLSTIDRRTRRSHWRADGQRVALDAKFVVGHAQLDHPGDPRGPAEEVVSCRCSMLVLDADETTPDTVDRQMRPAGEVQAEIDRRAADGELRALDDPDAPSGPRAPVQQESPQARTADAGTPPLTDPDPPDAGTVDTVTAAGSGPGATFGTEGTAMPRKWVSDPYLAPFGVATGDGRIFKTGSLRARELPLPLTFQESSGPEHDGSVVVGKIEEAGFPAGGITAAGEYLDDPAVAESVAKAIALTDAGLGHVSVELGAVTAELVDEAGNAVSWEDLFDAWDAGEDPVVLEQVTDGELLAVTQVATPAFAMAKIRLADLVAALMDTAGVDIGVGDTVDVETDAGTVRGRVTGVDEAAATVSVQPVDGAGADAGDPLSVAPAAVTVVVDVDEPTEPAPTAAVGGVGVFAVDAAGTTVGVGDAVTVDLRDEAGEVTETGIAGTVTAVVDADGDTPALVTVARDDGGDDVAVPASSVTVLPATEEAAAAEAGALAAAAVSAGVLLAGAGPLRPKREWFDQQPLTGPTALTITDDGQVYGHVAQWGQCHVGFTNTCWTAPESATGYAHFHVGEVVCDDGSHVPVGNLTLGPRHADERLGYRAAVEHYDLAAAGAAVGRCYEDEHGIQFAGALTPGVTEEQLYDLRRCPVSGDWRKIGANLELIGVLSVNSGGYPTPRFATDHAGRTALVAAPGVPVPALEEARGRRRYRTGGLDSRRVLDRLKAELRAELAADERRRRKMAGVAASIGRDPRSRLAELAARVAR